MADRQSELSGARAEMTHFIFTDEDKEYAESIIEGYKKALPPSNGMSVRRIK